MMFAMLFFVFIAFSNINPISPTPYACNSNSSCGCSGASTIVTSRIVGGEDAPNHAWSWIVSFQQSGSHMCGASLLTPEYAVTAGHCIEDLQSDMSSLSIVAGTNYLNDMVTMQRRSILKMVLHPNYLVEVSGNVLNDIGILQFAPLTMSSTAPISFICLPMQNQDPFQVNDSLVAIGWGYTEENGEDLPNSLQQVTVQVYSSTSAECNTSGMSNSSLEFCAGVAVGGKDTCSGDSGGPLMSFINSRWVLGGLTSSGQGCARINRVGLYTRVSNYISFINTYVNFTTIPTTTMSATQNYTVTTPKKNQGNPLHTSISISMFWLPFLVFFF